MPSARAAVSIVLKWAAWLELSTSQRTATRASLVLRFAIMMTYSCRRPRGSTTEFGEQRGEIAAREGPLERLRRVDVVFLEAKKPLTDRTERTEVIRREDLALDDGEIDLNLIEPTGVDGGVDEHELRPPGLQPRAGAVAPMRGTVVRDPEDTPSRAIRFLPHDLRDEPVEGRDAGLRFAAPEHPRAMHIPGGDIGPGAGASVLVLDPERSTRRGRLRRVAPTPGLDARFFIGAEHVLPRPEGNSLPAALVEIQDSAGLKREVRIARKDPAAIAPRSQRVLAEPAPQRGAADLRHDSLRHHLAPKLRHRPARQRRSEERRVGKEWRTRWTTSN